MRMPCSYDPMLINRIIAFHGHFCPGLAIGIRASELARDKLGKFESIDLVSIVETDMCGVDAIQFLTGCTFGKGNLIHKNFGKMAFTFYDRKSGRGFRALLRPEIQQKMMESETFTLTKKVLSGNATPEENSRYKNLRSELQYQYMTAELEYLFETQEIETPIPKPARILESLRCEDCGEMTMESRTRRFAGRGSDHGKCLYF